MKVITVLLADDHPIVRHGLKSVLAQMSNIHIIAEAQNGDEALLLLELHQPQIAIIDISMPGKNGLDILKELRQKHAEVKVIINTGFKDESLLKSALSFGAKGFLLKENALTEIGHCIEKVITGGRYISSELTEMIITGEGDEEAGVFSGLASLTLSEKKILKYVSQGKSTKDIASELFLSYRTVENHRNNICKKLGLSGGNALLKFAIDNKEKL
ncbi:MAG: DNA-binding response regulator [Ignavibacteriales bacterium]